MTGIVFRFLLLLVVVCSAPGRLLAADKPAVVGYIAQRDGPWPLDAAFLEGMRQQGQVEGNDFVMEYRWTPDTANLPAAARDLAKRGVSVIVTSGYPANKAAKDATATIPIVMATSGDAVQEGLVASLARPGGNLTGLSVVNRELSGKRVEVLREAVPGLRRIGALFNGSNPAMPPQFSEVKAAAAALGIETIALDVNFPDGIGKAFESASRDNADAIMVLSDSATIGNRTEIAATAIRYKMPTIFANRAYLQAGGLLSYGPDLTDNFRSAARFVTRIIRGEKPAEMPVEQPTRFELVINQKTAAAIGIKVPHTLVFRADDIFE